MASPVFQSVNFLDPWGTIPPGTKDQGVQVTLSNPNKAPASNYFLIGRLLQGNRPLAYGLGGGPGYVNVPPPGPLSAALPYTVQVQWVAPTNPQQPASKYDWTVGGIVSAPVITTGLTLTAGTAGQSQLALSWAAAGPAQPTAGNVLIFDMSAKPTPLMVTFVSGPGSGSAAFTPDQTKTYAAYASAAALIDPYTPSMAGLYTIGPFSPPVALPSASPTLTAVTYDGSTLAVGWTAPTLPTSPIVADPSYALLLLSGTAVVGRFPADAGGGTVAVDPATLGAAPAVAGAVSFGTVAGPVGTGQTVLATPPVVTGVTMAASSQSGKTDVTVKVTAPAGLPSTASVRVRLLQDGATVATGTASGTPLQATLTAALAAGSRYTVVADTFIAATSSVPATTSPATAPLALVPGPVTGVAVSYDGDALRLTWSPTPDPALTGYRVAVTGLAQTAFSTGPTPVLSIPAGLAVGAAVTATVTPLAGPAAGLPSTPASFTVPAPAAPKILEATVDGDQLALTWQPSAGPWLDGYTVKLAGTVAMRAAPSLTVFTGLATSATVTLPAQDQAVAWTVTVAATAGGTAGPASSAVALFPAVPEVTSVAVAGATATVGWAVVPGTSAVLAALAAAAARVQVQVLDDGNVVAAGSTTIAAAATGSLAVTLPSPVTSRLRIAAQLVSGAQTGSRSDAAAVLAAAPTVTFGALIDDALTLRWSASGDAGVTGYRVCAGPTCVTTSDTNVVLPLPAGATTSQKVTVTPVGADTTGPAASVAVVSPYGVSQGGYANGVLSVTLTAAGTPAPTSAWVDVLVDGAVAARTAAAGTPGAVTVPIALPPGTPAQVRAAGVGSGSLAPPSAPVAIPTTPPAGVGAAYDGSQLHVAWDPVPDPGVTGYVVTVNGASPAVPATYVSGATSAGTAIAATFSGAFPGSASVTVQASVATAGSARIDGPAGAAVPTLAGSVRSVAATATGQPPYALRHGAYATLAQAKGQPVTVYLDNPFATGTPTVHDSGSPVTFTLAPVTPAVSGGPAYQLTIAQTVWTSFDGSAARTNLRATYRSFLKAVDAAVTTPGGIALVRQAIAAAMPQTFAETLYYRYGVWREINLRAVDLDPGLRLRLTGAVYQAPSAAITDPVNGYVALGTEEYDLAEIFPAGTVQGLAPALTVDAFLASLLPGGGSATGTTVAAGSADFFGPGARQPFFRLFYPATFPSSGSVGSDSPSDSVAVLGAPSWTALENATDIFVQSGSPPIGQPLFVAYFRGRAMLTPLAAASVDGQIRWVPVGTTVRQLLAAAGAPAAAAAIGAQVRLTRTAASIFDSPQGGAPLHAEPVDLSGADLGGLVPQLWPIDLPLLGGDEVTLSPAAPTPS